MNYYKRHWNEPTEDPSTDHWGHSTYYFETNHKGIILRQLQQFENGQTLKYDLEYIDDKYGGHPEVPLNLLGFKYLEIEQTTFETVWNNAESIRFPEIVSTLDTLQGSPRLEGRRLSVGDIVDFLDSNDLHSLQADFDLSLQQIRQAVHYCSIRHCEAKKVIKYCHNCTLRAKQKGQAIEDEQDNWSIAKELLRKCFK